MKNWQVVIITAVVIGLGGLIYFTSQPKEEIVKVNTYEVDFKNSFVSGCVDDVTTFTQCDCSYDKLLEKYGFDGLYRVSKEYDETQILPDGAVEAITECL